MLARRQAFDRHTSSDQALYVEVMGSYSNPSLVSRIGIILAGQRDERPSSRPHQSRQFQRRLSVEEIAELVEAYEQGATQQELAVCFGIHRTTVASHLDAHGFANRRGGMTAEQVTEAMQLYADGWSLARIGKRYRAYPSSVWYWLRKNGVTLRPRQGWNS